LAIPTTVGASDTFCMLTLANCVGTGGGVTGSCTNNQLAKFTSTGSTIGDSTILDNGTTVAFSAALNVSGNTDLAGTLFVGTADAFQVSSGGAVTAVGLNSGSGQIQGTGGLTVT